jgi:hypothetical protein
MEHLIMLGVVRTLRRWIDAMLRCRRSVRVEIRGSSVRVSLLFWNMVVDGLLRRLYNAHYQAQDYADDVVLPRKSKVVSTLCNRMQGALNCVGKTRQQWSRSRITERGLLIILDFLVLN